MTQPHFISPKLCIRDTNRGLGVFLKPCTAAVCGEILEISPFSSCYARPWKEVSEDLRKIVYSYPTGHDNYVIGLGYTSLYNHSDNNNAVWTSQNNSIIIQTISEIHGNEEVFIHYGDAYWSGGWTKY